jgi:hypothetical protein
MRKKKMTLVECMYIPKKKIEYHINKVEEERARQVVNLYPTKSQKTLGEVNKMAEGEPKGNQPDYKGEGVAVWVNEDKNKKKYLSIVVLNSIRLAAFKNEPKEKKEDI